MSGKQTQVGDILRYMTDHGSITPMEALQEFGCMRLASRIHDIKTLGYAVGKKMETRKNRYGKTVSYARYWLEK